MTERSSQFGRLSVRIRSLLLNADSGSARREWSLLPARKAVSPLLSFLCSADEKVKWRAVTAVGIVVAKLAAEDLEAARVIVRRLIWSLNDESGGIGWGAPEAMGEIMAVHEGLGKEYVHILVSYIREDGNPLENDLLERGVLWGLGRIARVRPHLVRAYASSFLPYLSSKDPVHRGLAAWALGFLDIAACRHCLEPLLKDVSELLIFEDDALVRTSVSELAGRALTRRR